MELMNISTKASAPYGLTVIQSCLTCPMHEEGLFCRLSHESLRQLDSIRQNAFYPQGALLFVEGEPPRGLFILCSGQVKLTASSKDGKSVTLRQVETGEILGLSSVIANGAYPATAETQSPSQVNFIPREQFLRFLHAHGDVSTRVAEHLSMELHKAWEQTRLLALSPSAQARLAQLLLGWATRHGKNTSEGVRIPLHMTHEEVAENIGATRETVSRLLGDFKRRGLIRVKAGSLLLLKLEALRALSAV